MQPVVLFGGDLPWFVHRVFVGLAAIRRSVSHSPFPLPVEKGTRRQLHLPPVVVEAVVEAVPAVVAVQEVARVPAVAVVVLEAAVAAAVPVVAVAAGAAVVVVAAEVAAAVPLVMTLVLHRPFPLHHLH